MTEPAELERALGGPRARPARPNLASRATAVEALDAAAPARELDVDRPGRRRRVAGPASDPRSPRTRGPRRLEREPPANTPAGPSRLVPTTSTAQRRGPAGHGSAASVIRSRRPVPVRPPSASSSALPSEAATRSAGQEGDRPCRSRSVDAPRPPRRSPDADPGSQRHRRPHRSGQRAERVVEPTSGLVVVCSSARAVPVGDGPAREPSPPRASWKRMSPRTRRSSTEDSAAGSAESACPAGPMVADQDGASRHGACTFAGVPGPRRCLTVRGSAGTARSRTA